MQKVKQTHVLMFSVTEHFVGQFRDKDETYYLEEDNNQSLYIFRSSDQPESSINKLQTDELPMPGMNNRAVAS